MTKKYYSPSNGTEWDMFRENNCWSGCEHYSHAMEYDRDAKVTCPILFKLLEQMGLPEDEFPDVYYFSNAELDTTKCPAVCLKKEIT